MKKPAPIQLLAHFFTVVILMTCLSCEDDNIFKQLVDPPAKVLPPATQIGANTYGCKVNGKVWLPSETAWMEFKDGGLVLKAENKYSPWETIIMTIEKYTIINVGTYVISSNTNYLSKGVYWKGDSRFQTDSINTGSITITRLDTSMRQYIISGTFSFKAKDVVTGEVVEVIDGRFDLKNY